MTDNKSELNEEANYSNELFNAMTRYFDKGGNLENFDDFQRYYIPKEKRKEINEKSRV